VAKTPEEGLIMARAGKPLLLTFAMLVSIGVHAAQPASTAPAPAATAGEAVYQRWCSHCHSAGRGNPGTDSLQVKYAGKVPAVLLERTDLNADAVKLFVRQGVLSMPHFRKTEITDAELAQLAGYVARNFRR
jgi:mono/diheme cytochrome c family protein